MNAGTLEIVKEIQKESCEDVSFVGDVLNPDEKLNNLNIAERAQKLEHDERKMRLEESKQKLEAEKFEYQKKQNKKDNLVKIVVAALAGTGAIAGGVAKIVQVCMQRKYIKEAYNIEQLTTIASPTARTLLKDGSNPKL